MGYGTNIEYTDTQILNAAQPKQGAAVTPNDSTDLTNEGTLYIGGAGDLKVDTLGGSTLTFVGLAAGSFFPIPVKRVYATGTDATDIIVLY